MFPVVSKQILTRLGRSSRPQCASSLGISENLIITVILMLDIALASGIGLALSTEALFLLAIIVIDIIFIV